MHFEPVIETPFGGTKAEVRVMYVWLDELTPVLTIIRMGRGLMMGVDHNKNMEWVGASAGFYLAGGARLKPHELLSLYARSKRHLCRCSTQSAGAASNRRPIRIPPAIKLQSRQQQTPTNPNVAGDAEARESSHVRNGLRRKRWRNIGQRRQRATTMRNLEADNQKRPRPRKTCWSGWVWEWRPKPPEFQCPTS